jgi:hypothetical protein
MYFLVVNVYILTVDTTNIGISYVFSMNLSLLHVSTILSGHHQALMNITQVIKLLVKIRMRILTTDGCVARECMFIY